MVPVVFDLYEVVVLELSTPLVVNDFTKEFDGSLTCDGLNAPPCFWLVVVNDEG